LGGPDGKKLTDKRISVAEDTAHAQVFGKYRREVLSIKIRSNTADSVSLQAVGP
jgi:hypothetical protein